MQAGRGRRVLVIVHFLNPGWKEKQNTTTSSGDKIGWIRSFSSQVLFACPRRPGPRHASLFGWPLHGRSATWGLGLRLLAPVPRQSAPPPLDQAFERRDAGSRIPALPARTCSVTQRGFDAGVPPTMRPELSWALTFCTGTARTCTLTTRSDRFVCCVAQREQVARNSTHPTLISELKKILKN